MTIGEKIRQERTRQGLSMAQFGDKLGVTRQCINQWELDINKPSDDMKIKIHDVLGWPYSIFFED